MNGDDITSREIGDLIKHVDGADGIKTCKAHPFMQAATIKSLRLNEQNHRLHKWSIALGISILVSIWFKGINVSDFVQILLQSVACAGTP